MVYHGKHTGSYLPCHVCGYKWTFASKFSCHACGKQLQPPTSSPRRPGGRWADGSAARAAACQKQTPRGNDGDWKTVQRRKAKDGAGNQVGLRKPPGKPVRLGLSWSELVQQLKLNEDVAKSDELSALEIFLAKKAKESDDAKPYAARRRLAEDKLRKSEAELEKAEAQQAAAEKKLAAAKEEKQRADDHYKACKVALKEARSQREAVGYGDDEDGDTDGDFPSDGGSVCEDEIAKLKAMQDKIAQRLRAARAKARSKDTSPSDAGDEEAMEADADRGASDHESDLDKELAAYRRSRTPPRRSKLHTGIFDQNGEEQVWTPRGRTAQRG